MDLGLPAVHALFPPLLSGWLISEEGRETEVSGKGKTKNLLAKQARTQT